jgi:hypothetical protein
MFIARLFKLTIMIKELLYYPTNKVKDSKKSSFKPMIDLPQVEVIAEQINLPRIVPLLFETYFQDLCFPFPKHKSLIITLIFVTLSSGNSTAE